MKSIVDYSFKELYDLEIQAELVKSSNDPTFMKLLFDRMNSVREDSLKEEEK